MPGLRRIRGNYTQIAADRQMRRYLRINRGRQVRQVRQVQEVQEVQSDRERQALTRRELAPASLAAMVFP